MRPRWTYFPDFRQTVPYQTLLADELAKNFDVNTDWLDNIISTYNQAERRIFHLHWQNAVYSKAKTENDAEMTVSDFIKKVELFQSTGGLLIWTVHNLYPHENIFPRAEALLQKGILTHANVVHVHNNTTASELVKLGIPIQNLIVYPLPSMKHAYPDHVSEIEARSYFGINPTTMVFSFLGMVRNYKGVDILREAYRRYSADNRDSALIIAGDQGSLSRSRYLYASGTYTIPRFIEDSTVQYVFRAANYGVLPYRQITTSGALMLGLGFGRPMIVPGLNTLLDDVTDKKEVLTFIPGDVDDLANTLKLAHELKSETYLGMCRHATLLCSQVTFHELARVLRDATSVL